MREESEEERRGDDKGRLVNCSTMCVQCVHSDSFVKDF